ncbi:MAG: response regulator transcription factor [Phycisphaerales bacterium]|nr:response regulator transcription factor [Phycisphaerales bacterium]
MSRIGVLLVDDHAMLRAGMKMLIGAQPDLEVVGEAGSLRDAVELARKLAPAVVTLDLTMPGGGGVEGVQKVLAASPASRVLVLTMHDDPAYVRSALALGAAGYIVKSAADTELIGAIRAVARGRVFVDIQQAKGSDFLTPQPGRKQSPFDSLSDREREVLIEVAKGYTNQQIADRVGLSVKTIESYRARLMQKLGLKDRADLMRLAVEAGLLKASDAG